MSNQTIADIQRQRNSNWSLPGERKWFTSSRDVVEIAGTVLRRSRSRFGKISASVSLRTESNFVFSDSVILVLSCSIASLCFSSYLILGKSSKRIKFLGISLNNQIVFHRFPIFLMELWQQLELHIGRKKSKENGRRNESWRASSQKTLWTKWCFG
jgi:hypothetical protein